MTNPVLEGSQGEGNGTCPLLPPVSKVLRATYPRVFREASMPDYYRACLETAHSLWLQNLPAQAILQLNKALACDFHPAPKPPYDALAWILSRPVIYGFLGNPTRHFQHLASRMPRLRAFDEIRRWRAWACFHLSHQILSPKDFPIDEIQVVREKLRIPEIKQILNALRSSPWDQEAKYFEGILRSQTASSLPVQTD